MENTENKPEKSEIRKENQDFPNMPASTEKNESGETMKEEIHQTSKLQDEGKTDNTDKATN